MKLSRMVGPQYFFIVSILLYSVTRFQLKKYWFIKNRKSSDIVPVFWFILSWGIIYCFYFLWYDISIQRNPQLPLSLNSLEGLPLLYSIHGGFRLLSLLSHINAKLWLGLTLTTQTTTLFLRLCIWWLKLNFISNYICIWAFKLFVQLQHVPKKCSLRTCTVF